VGPWVVGAEVVGDVVGDVGAMLGGLLGAVVGAVVWPLTPLSVAHHPPNRVSIGVSPALCHSIAHGAEVPSAPLDRDRDR
jgi:hypothetical protein